MTPLQATFKALTEAAIAYASGDIYDKATQHALAIAAQEYSKARWATKTGVAANKSRPEVVLAFGKHKGKRLSECDRGYLSWLLGSLVEGLDANKTRDRARDTRLADDIRAELEAR